MKKYTQKLVQHTDHELFNSICEEYRENGFIMESFKVLPTQNYEGHPYVYIALFVRDNAFYKQAQQLKELRRKVDAQGIKADIPNMKK